MNNVIDLLARILLSAVFFVNGIAKTNNIDGTVGWMEMFGLPGFLIYPAIILELIVPLFIVIGFYVKLSSLLLGSFCILTAVIFLRDLSDPMTLTNFLKNFAMAGGFFILYLNGSKKFSLDYYFSQR
jgi:putative oxidoreductase